VFGWSSRFSAAFRSCSDKRASAPKVLSASCRKLRTDSSLHHLRHRHKVIPFRLVPGNQPVRNDDRPRPVIPKCPMRSIMQQNHIPAVNVRYDFFLNVLHRRRTPVIAGDIPHHGHQSQPARLSQRLRSSTSERRTEQIRMFAHGIRNRLSALQQFFSNLTDGFKSQMRMSKSMVADHMSSLHHIPNNIGTLSHISPHQKKCRFDFMPGQNIQQLLRVRIIGPVVIRQSQLFRSAGQSRKRSSIPLASRRHRLITSRERRRDACRCEDWDEHDADCKRQYLNSPQRHTATHKIHA
jgi:hypothetical protein